MIFVQSSREFTALL